MQPNPQIAAVLILVYPHDGQPHLVFTRRSETVGLHRGQISLPGGRREASDASLAATAVRETEEELGVPASHVEILGHLPDVHVVVSNFVITPYVGTTSQRPTFRPNLDEVAEVIEVPLAALVNPQTFREEVWPWRGEHRLIQFYGYGPHQIWGATARVIQEFLVSDYVQEAAGALGLAI